MNKFQEDSETNEDEDELYSYSDEVFSIFAEVNKF